MGDTSIILGLGMAMEYGGSGRYYFHFVCVVVGSIPMYPTCRYISDISAAITWTKACPVRNERRPRNLSGR